MKTCRWTYQSIIWAILLFLCCCGNVADDPKPNVLVDKKDQENEEKASSSSSTEADRTEQCANYESPADKKDEGLNPETTVNVVADVERVENRARQQQQQQTDEEAEKSSTSEQHSSNSSAEPKENVVLLNEEEPSLNAVTVEAVLTSSTEVEVPSNETVMDEGPVGGSNESNIEVATTESVLVSEVEVRAVPDVGGRGSPSILGDGGVVTPSEEMPSFNEWAKKRLEEQEKNGHPTGGASQMSKVSGKQKLRHKNYASTDCGAKILNANPEAQGTSAVLGHYTDDYMLNPCMAKIWLVIELCESIQVERIEMANFELFSSSPKDFSVYASDRYPTREWKLLGNFEAKDERVMQNFSLHHNTFGKFFKLEVGSHYGSEHFCPLSRLRVYGTSEYEALDTEEPPEEKIQDSADEDELLDEPQSSQESPNLFGSAKDAVINIVKKAAQVLRSDQNDINVKQSGNKSVQETVEVLMSPVESKVNTNCMCVHRFSDGGCDLTQVAVDNLTQLLQCEYHKLKEFLMNGWGGVTRHLFHQACVRTCAPFITKTNQVGEKELRLVAEKSDTPLCRFYWAFLGPTRFGAACKLDKLLLDEKRGVPTEKTSCPYSNVSTTPILSPSLDILGGGTNKKGTNAAVDPMHYSSQIGTTSSGEVTSSLGGGERVTEPEVGETKDGSAEAATKLTGTGGEEKIVPTKTLLPDDTVPVLISPDDKVSEKVSKPASDVLNSSESDLNSFQASLNSPIQPSEVPSSSMTEMTVTSSHGESSQSSSDGSSSSLILDFEQGGCSVFPFASESPVLDADGLLAPSKSGGSSTSFQDATVIISPQADLVNGSVVSISNGGKTVKQPSNGGEETGFLPPPMSVTQKESVFVRLTNRIKALELNMSLSSQYLEELSRRYKKQMEEMQKSFNKTILALNETAKMAHERDLKQQEMISQMTSQLNNMSALVNSLLEQQVGVSGHMLMRHMLFMIIEAVVLVSVIFACLRRRNQLPLLTEHGLVAKTLKNKRNEDDGDAKEDSRLTADKKMRSIRSSSLGNLGGVRIEALESSPTSEELISNRVWEDLSTSSCSSVQTDKSWQEVENHKKRKKKNRNNNHNNNNNNGQGKTGLYRSLSNNILVGMNSSGKPPIVPPHAKQSRNSAAGLLFDSSKSRQEPPIKRSNSSGSGGFMENSTTTTFATNHSSRSRCDEVNENGGYHPTTLQVLSSNRFSTLPHYESRLLELKTTSGCRPKQTIIERAPNFNMKKTSNVVWG